MISSSFFFNDPAPTDIYTLSLHDALPISPIRQASRLRLSQSLRIPGRRCNCQCSSSLLAVSSFPESSTSHCTRAALRSEEHTSELQSQSNLVCRLLLEKKKI